MLALIDWVKIETAASPVSRHGAAPPAGHLQEGRRRLLRLQPKSKSAQIQDHIRRRIRSGQLRAGQRLPSERQLASRYGVNLHTVNKAMAALETELLLERSPGRGTYVRADISRGMVAVIFPAHLMTWPAGSPFWETLMRRLGGLLEGHRFSPHFLLSSGTTDEEIRASLQPGSRLWQQVAGVVTRTGMGGFEDELSARGVPTVVFGDQEGPGRHIVTNDNALLGRRAAEHLLARGYRRIGIITPEPAEPEGVITAGFRSALRAGGVELREERCIFHASRMGGEDAAAFRRLWARADRPEAVLISDDSLALGIGRAIVEMGIRVPGELAVITHACAGVPMDFPLPFTTCRYDVGRISRALYGMLERLIRGGPRDRGVVRVRPRVVQGQTT